MTFRLMILTALFALGASAMAEPAPETPENVLPVLEQSGPYYKWHAFDRCRMMPLVQKENSWVVADILLYQPGEDINQATQNREILTFHWKDIPLSENWKKFRKTNSGVIWTTDETYDGHTYHLKSMDENGNGREVTATINRDVTRIEYYHAIVYEGAEGGGNHITGQLACGHALTN
jgi:hypothetical protein